MILSSSTAMANFPHSFHSFMFQTHGDDHHDHLPSTSLDVPPSLPPQHFHGGACFMMKRSVSFSGMENKCDPEVHGVDELSDDGCQIGEKKKRLSLEQVKALEKSFELGNKLEPERKMQLAKALGLQPRQIAIWFQNRRARWKTKKLEKEYEGLKKHFEALKADNDTLQAQNKKLHAELQALRGGECYQVGTLSLKKENDGSWSNGSTENSSDFNLDPSRTPVINSPLSSHHQNIKNLLPDSIKPTSITQLLQCSSRSDLQDENFNNMFRSVDDQHNFWTWPEQNHFH